MKSPLRGTQYRWLYGLLTGLLVTGSLIGMATWLWAAVPSGAPVLYNPADTVTVPILISPDLRSTGAFSASGSLAFTGDLTPTALTADVDNYNPTGLATAGILRLSSTAAWAVKGLATGSDGRVLFMANVGAQNIILSTEATSSTAANRFDLSADLTLPPKGMITLSYDSTTSRWRAVAAVLPGGPLTTSVLTLQQQGTDPATPPAGSWYLYAKSTGIHARDPSGTVAGPFGAGGAGGTATVATVLYATTGQVTLSGEQALDGPVTNASLVLVKDQLVATENGLWVTSPSGWTRSTAFNTSAEFVSGFPVYVQAGTVNGQTVWNFSTVGNVTLGTTNLSFTRTGPGPLGELLINKNAGNGYPGARSDGNILHDRVGSYAAHTALAAGNAITVTARQMGIEGTGPDGTTTDLTANPQISGTPTPRDGTETELLGTNALRPVKIDNGTGVRLCGNTGSVIVGLDGATLPLKWNAGLSLWQQRNCLSLGSAKNSGASMVATQTTPVIVQDAGGTNRWEFYVDSTSNIPTQRALCGGAPCPQSTVGPLPSGGEFRVLNSLSEEIFSVQENGTITPAGGGGAVTTTVPMRLDTVNFANANVFISPQTRTNYDTNVLEFLETGSACAFFTADIPANLATTPAWNIQISHSAASGGAANVVLTAAARIFGNGDAKDAALTALTLAGGGVIAVQTSANLTRTSLASTNFDGTVALAASRLLRVKLCRDPAHASDSSTVSWLLERSPVVTLSVN